MTWPIGFSPLIGCSFILEEAANPESAKDSVRYLTNCPSADRRRCARPTVPRPPAHAGCQGVVANVVEVECADIIVTYRRMGPIIEKSPKSERAVPAKLAHAVCDLASLVRLASCRNLTKQEILGQPY